MEELKWSTIKALIDTDQVEIKWIENPVEYKIYAYDGSFLVVSIIQKGTADATDFENNYKVNGPDIFRENPIRGGTDDTRIGNIGDRLKVNASLSGGTNLRYDDMNASTGGVARNTLIGNTFTQVYSHTGAGDLIGFLLTLEKIDDSGGKEWYIRLQVDGEEVFGPNGLPMSDFTNKNIYQFEVKPIQDQLALYVQGFSVSEAGIRWRGPNGYDIRYESSIKIFVRKASDPKVFRAGLVTLTKET